MPAQWTGRVVGKMHVRSITAKELAAHMGVRVEYVSMVLHGKRSPKDAEARFSRALDELIAQRDQQKKEA